MFHNPRYSNPELSGRIAADACISVAEIKIGALIGKGGNATVYESSDNPDLVVRIQRAQPPVENKEEIDKHFSLMEALNKLPPCIGAARIRGAGFREGKICQVIEKAAGQELHSKNEDFETWRSRLKTLADAPQGHFDKFVSDGKTLVKAGFFIDPSKPDNFFYCNRRGFTFVDLALKANADQSVIQLLPVPLIYTTLFHRYNEQGRLDPDIKAEVSKILQKCQSAGIECIEGKCSHSISDIIKYL